MSAILHSARIRPSLSNKPRISTIFLQLPPVYRSFHATPKPQFLEIAVQGTQSLIETLHSTTGLPWAYSIPLAALTLRLTCILPFAIISRRTLGQQAALTPLMTAWQHPLRKDMVAEFGHLGPNVFQSNLMRATRRKRDEIYKRYGCQNWKQYLPPIIQIPIWLTAMEAFREMCGWGKGLLGMLISSFPGAEPATVVEGSSVVQSFATEGALWFPNLLAPDPLLILPFVLSGTILLNILSLPSSTKWQKRLKRGLGLMGLVMGPLMLQVPSAMLIYWISSSSMGILQTKILEIVMPIEKPVMPCKPRQQQRLLGDGMEKGL